MLDMANTIEYSKQSNVFIAQVSNSDSTKRKYVVGDCMGVDNSNGFTTEHSGFTFEPKLAASYLNRVTGKKLHLNSEVNILLEPKHGKIEIGRNEIGEPVYYYHPNKDFFGKDEARFIVKSGKVEVEVRHYFHVVNHPIGNLTDKELCKNKTLWRIAGANVTQLKPQTPASAALPSPIAIPASFLSLDLLAFSRVRRAEYGWVLDAEKLQLQTRLNPAALNQAAITAQMAARLQVVES